MEPSRFAPDVPTSDEFTRTLGQVSWLLTLSKKHREQPISFIETSICVPLMFKQLRVFLKGKQPVAALTWAYVSVEVAEKVKCGDELALADWRSGPDVVVVDCISPLLDPQVFIKKFNAELSAIQERQ